VEEVGKKGKKAFTNYDELWEILISSKGINHHGKAHLPGGRSRREKGGS
jgi:hypothetical protein